MPDRLGRVASYAVRVAGCEVRVTDSSYGIVVWVASYLQCLIVWVEIKYRKMKDSEIFSYGYIKKPENSVSIKLFKRTARCLSYSRSIEICSPNPETRNA